MFSIHDELNSKNVQNIYKLSPMQEGIYFHGLMEVGTAAYFCQNSYSVSHLLNEQSLQKSFQWLVDRHDILRTVFSYKKTEVPVQVVLKRRKAAFSYSDISQEDSPAKIVKSFREADISNGFDLEKDNLIRLTVFRTGVEHFEFVWSNHHIILDGWCAALLMQEFMEAYIGFESGQPVLKKPAPQFVKYISWLEESHKISSEQFWLEELEDITGVTGIGSAKNNISKGDNFTELTLKVSQELTLALHKIAGINNVTRYTVLQAVWAIMLSRINNSNDVIFGSVISIRPAEIQQVDAIIGLFINTVPVRIKLSENVDFISLVKSVQKQFLAAQSYHSTPLSKIQSLVSQGNSLIDHVLIMENFPVGEKGNDPLGLQSKITFDSSFSQTNYNFNLVFIEGAELEIRFNYNSNVHNEGYVKQLASSFLTVMERCVLHPEELIESVTLVCEKDKEKLLEFGTGPTIGSKETIIQLFDKRVFDSAKRIALIDANKKTYTYGHLQKLSFALSDVLRSRGCGSKEFVAVMCDNSVLTVVAMLAIMRSGNVYIPLDSNLPRERISHIVTDLKLKFLIKFPDTHLGDISYDGEIISLDVAELSYENSEYSDHSLPDAVAYMIYTSGTSGLPKAVPIRHESITGRIIYHNEYLSIDEDERILQFASVSFDASLVEIFMSLTTGANLILIDKKTKENLPLLVDTLNGQKVTLVILPPSFLRLLRETTLPDLKKIISTGEAALLPDALFFAKTKMVVNGYGPTETCVGASFHRVDYSRKESYNNAAAGLPIGKPFADTNVYILDGQQRLLPVGFPGELCIAGPGLSRGYLNNEELSDQKFILNPYSTDEAYKYIYRSGDLARWNEIYELEYIGRIDAQVQVRGIRVELAELEHAFRNINGISNVAVKAFQIDGDTRLVAYVVSSEVLREQDLRLQLSKSLPAYMLPWKIIFLEALPVTSNGKLDLIKLELPVESRADYAIVLPSTEAEKDLLDAFSSILGKEEISVQDNFFELGGDSIKAIQVSSRLYRKGWALEVKNIFINPVLQDMAAIMQPATRQADQHGVEGAIPLSAIQKDFFNRKLVAPHHFNQSILLKSDDGFKPEIFQQVLQGIFNHHDALRILFRKKTGGWEQINEAAGKQIIVPVIDLATNRDQAAELGKICQQIQESFDLQTGPLFKATIFRVADGYRLFLVAHHLVVDGISWRILLEDLSEGYANLMAGKKAQLPLKTDSFKKWAEAMESYANTTEFIEQESHWLVQQNLGENKLSRKASFPAKDSYSFSLTEKETTTLLTKTHTAFGTEINDILLCALSIAVRDVFATNKVWVMLEGHGRDDFNQQLDITRTVGWFTNLFPVLLNTPDGTDLSRHIKIIKESLRAAPHKGLGYGLARFIRKEKSFETVKNINPQILFNYLGQFDQDIKNSQFEIAAESYGHTMNQDEGAFYEMMIAGYIRNQKLSIKFNYESVNFDSNDVEMLGESFRHWVNVISDYCAGRKEQELTPSDLEYKQISIESLSMLQQHYKNHILAEIEDIYRLTPMQEGMLFHALLENDSMAYFYQVDYAIQGNLLPDLVQQSGIALLKRHAVLRTVFEKDSCKHLVQVVLNHRELPFVFEDLSTLPDQVDKKEYIDQFMANDRKRGFDLSKDVLFRLALFQLSPDEFVFVWSCHHIAMDGWCMGILIAEFKEIYISLAAKKSPALSLVRPFKNYVHWLHNLPGNSGLSYWRKYLEDYETSVKVPGSQLLPSEIPYKSLHHLVDFSPEQTMALLKLAASNNVTINTVLQTAWGILLSKYNDTEDVVFGSIVSGRSPFVEGIESMIGLFINCIPVRIRYEGTDSFMSIVRKTQAEAAASETHHYCSLAQIQGVSVLKQNLIDHFIEFENYPIAERIEGIFNGKQEATGNELKVTAVTSREFSNYNFSMVISIKEKLTLDFQFNNAVFSIQSIESLESHFRFLIEQILDDESKAIRDIELNSPGDIAELLKLSTGEIREYPTHVNYCELFERQVLLTPGNIALTDSGGEITYAELNAVSNRIARLLLSSEKNLQQKVVAVCLNRSVYWIASVLAIWKVGAVYLPIDPGLPDERINYMLDNASTAVVITTGKLGSANYITLTISEDSLSGLSDANLGITGLGGDCAYLLYTSGSTGQPKGAMIEHAGMLNHIFSKIEDLKITSRSVVAQTAAQSFDISIWQMFASLLVGGRVKIYSKEEVLDVSRFLKSVSRENVSILQLVPSFLAAILENLENEQKDLHFPSLEFVLSTGEELSKPLFDRWFDRVRTTPLVNAYGPTEASDDITHAIFSSKEDIALRDHHKGKMYNKTGAVFFTDYTSLFKKQLVVSESAVAVSYQNRSWTYKELDEKADFIGQHIQRHYSPNEEKVVAVFMERGFHLIATILAIWKTGGTYLPIDPSLPADRINYILKDAGAMLICYTGKKFGQSSIDQLDVNTQDLEGAVHFQNLSGSGSKDCAYILYTSGSTGFPKGVMIEQAGMLNHLYSRIERFNLDAGSRVAQTASQSFDISIWQMLAVLLVGGSVQVYSPDEVLDVSNLIEKITGDSVTVMQIVPSYLGRIVEIIETGQTKKMPLCLKYMATIGEELDRTLADKWLKLMPGIKLVNTYGPTEAADTIADHLVEQGYVKSTVPLGRPLNNLRIYVVDRHAKLCPVGVTGEIWVSGIGVGRGYKNLPEKTFESFLPDPFFEGDKVYKTGDLGCWSFEGNLEFHGRKDYQIKINGYRVELGEIERNLIQHAFVRQTVVLFTAPSCITAYVVAKEGKKVESPDLSEFLKLRLPSYMMPSQYVVLDSFPLSPSGKVDRHSLPAPIIGADSRQNPDEQLTETEIIVKEIWTNVLGISGLSKDENFFMVGGDSIKAIQITSRAYTAGYGLKVKDVFLAPTIAQLAHRLVSLETRIPVPVEASTGEGTGNYGYEELSADDLEFINATLN